MRKYFWVFMVVFLAAFRNDAVVFAQASPIPDQVVVEQRIIREESQGQNIANNQVNQPLPTFVYLILALIFLGIAAWAIKRYSANELSRTLFTRHPSRLSKIKRTKKNDS